MIDLEYVASELSDSIKNVDAMGYTETSGPTFRWFFKCQQHMVGIQSHKEKAYEMYEMNTFKNLPSEEVQEHKL